MTQAEEPTPMEGGPATQGAEDVYDLRVLVASSQDIFNQPGFVAQGAADMAGLKGFVSKGSLQTAINNFLSQPDAGHTTGG